MTSAFWAVYLREILIMKRRILRQSASMAVSPLLYVVAFGCALGAAVKVGDRSYLEFLIPGLAAMASMTQAFAIATEINVARFYFFAFEEFQAAPVSPFSYVLAETLAGVTKALYAVLIVLIIALLFGTRLNYGPAFWGALLLNSFSFAALAVALAMLVKSHADQSLLTAFVITPMAFLGGTFFPVDALPAWASAILRFLPLTHAADAARAGAFGLPPSPLPFIILACCSLVFFSLALSTVKKARN
ncbi:MAG: ABC transporter permease [Deltaproteobacteria bacterium]|jgi:ABC-type multidrug transport system permease subunit|nr:ABC transporter permease [Deltaproteobacteria bacterium]